MVTEDRIGFGLHDAVVEQIEVDWLRGELRIGLAAVVPVRQRVTLLAEGVSEFRCTRRMPWGGGDGVLYVNDMQVIAGAGNDAQLRLEMASGDLLEISAARFDRFDHPLRLPDTTT